MQRKYKKPERYAFAAKRMVETAEYKASGRWQTFPNDPDHPFMVVLIDCIQEAIENNIEPIRIPREACRLYMACR